MLSFTVLFPGSLQAEEITTSINYNPSRMGVFSYLKVANTLDLLGGASVTNNLNLKGKVKTLQYINAEGETSGKKLLVPTIDGSGTIRLPAATLSGRVNDADAGYQYTGTPTTNPSGTITLYGGVLQTTADSYVGTLHKTNHLQTYAGTFSTPSVTVKGKSSAVGLINSEGESDGSTKGLKLGNYDIAYPTVDNYEYKWIDMTFKNAQAKVLTLTGTGGVGSCIPTTPTHNGKVSYVENCSHIAGFELQVGTAYYTWNYGTCQYDLDISDCRKGHSWDYYGEEQTVYVHAAGTEANALSSWEGCGLYKWCSSEGVQIGASCSPANTLQNCWAYCKVSSTDGHGNFHIKRRVLRCQ